MTGEDGNPLPPDVALDADLVSRLVARQHPDLAGRRVVEVAAGWDNTTFRLGDDLAVRMPRRALAAPLIANEQRWLPHLAPRLPTPIPVPVRVGRPDLGYPWTWSVVPWFDGTAIMDAPLADLSLVAADVGRFLAALHQPAPRDAPVNPYRGVPLADRTPLLREGLAVLGARVDADAVLASWSRAVAQPSWAGPRVWLHGDLHAANLIVGADGRLAAVIDFGDLTSGDPATDLAVAWIAFGADDRATLRAAAGMVDDPTWERARGWAIAMAVAYTSSPLSTPAFVTAGRRILAAALLT